MYEQIKNINKDIDYYNQKTKKEFGSCKAQRLKWKIC